MNKKQKKSRDELEAFVNTGDYQNAVDAVRYVLRSHLLESLGGGWEKIHNKYGLYTINTRVKDTRRILDKFDRMVVKGREVSVKDFYQVMPDLVGGRLVAVDPGDLFRLAQVVKEGFTEPSFLNPGPDFVMLRVRHGRFSMYDVKPFQEAGYTVDLEYTGYCSVHFVYKVGPEFFNKYCNHDELAPVRKLDSGGRIPTSEWGIEVQVRTIMDEAWGEVDHFVRYEDPALRDDPNMTTHFAALAGFLQAANHHVSLILDLARRQSSD